MNYEIRFYTKEDSIEAVPINKHSGYAIAFVHDFDRNNKRKKRIAYAWSEDVMQAIEKHIKMQRDYLKKLKTTPTQQSNE